MQENLEDVELIDPDPLSVLLIALGAAGSIASIISLVEDRLRVRENERRVNRAAIRDAIIGVETSLNELRALVRSFEIVFLAGSERRSSMDSMSLAKFGSVSPLFTRSGHERWQEIGEDILRTAGRLQRHMNDLMRHFAGSNLRLPEHVARRVQGVVEEVNGVMLMLGHVHFAELFRALEQMIGNCGDLMRELRTELNDLLRDQR